MPLSLLHQCGHHSNWNFESFRDDGCGDGLIISPVHYAKNNVENLDLSTKFHSSFDPQYYLPNSQKLKFKSYDFFPQSLSGGFVTTDFGSVAPESAQKCLDFQVENGFERIIIPARFYSDMITDYTDKQDAYTVHPFLKVIAEMNVKNEVFLTFPVTSAMLLDDVYLDYLLNWAASFQEIDGVYFLLQDERLTKQIQYTPLLKKYLYAVKSLSDADLTVVVGHANTEGLLFSMIENCEITFGAYENTRMFSIDKFVVSDDGMRGPKARIYMPGLLNWIHFSHAKEIKAEFPELWGKIHHESDYANQVFEASEVKEPHFSQPKLYKHFFLSYQQQVNLLKPLSLTQRYDFLKGLLLSAQDNHEQLSHQSFDLDKHGNGEHIQPWLDAINWFKRSHM